MITVNETGYLPEAVKIAVSNNTGSFMIRDISADGYVQTDLKIRESRFDEDAGENVVQIDFSALHAPGIYRIEAEDGTVSCSFKIEPHVYRSLKNAALKALYFQRCGCGLDEKYAGKFSHDRCHTKKTRIYGEEGTLDIQGGWHDAGDFGRYVTAAAVAVAHILYAYEMFPGAFSESINIPESGNGIPDVLNECRYELDWMMQMQKEDGGVYHKQTTMHHAEFIMPEEDKDQMYVFPVSSLAVADFAAVMCLASRIYEQADPIFARDAVHAAVLAGRWLIDHPESTDFRNPDDCNTGEYNDDDDTDERLWAFCELIRTDYEIKNENDHSMMAGMPQKMSRQRQYRQQAAALLDKYFKKKVHADGRTLDDGFGWLDVSSFAALAVVFDDRNIAGDELKDRMYGMLVSRADAFRTILDESPYCVSMKTADYVWGSNMVAANRGLSFVAAAEAIRRRLAQDENCTDNDMTSNVKVIEYTVHDNDVKEHLPEGERQELALQADGFEKAALEQLHYICGRNAMDTSYVTGFGEHAFMHPHNRVCIADGIERPVPGEVSGGPCHPPVDDTAKRLVKPDTPAMKCYADDDMCYSLNEITIYWNSPVIFLAAYFDR